MDSDLTHRPCQIETDYERLCDFLRQVFLLNDRLEHAWHVARLDYWRWHFIATCKVCASVEAGALLWETAQGEIAAALTGLGAGEVRLHLHPHHRTAELQAQVLAAAEAHFSAERDGERVVYFPVDTDDALLQQTLRACGWRQGQGVSHKWRRDLDASLPDAPTPLGYTVRSMGGPVDFPARSWASWTSFHNDEPETAYDGDASWLANLQAAPLYRNDLDLVAEAPGGDLAAFCTIFYDEPTRAAVCVLVGTAADHWRKGLGKALLAEGFRRLQRLSCTRVFATAYDPPAGALYGAMFQANQPAQTWFKVVEARG